MTDLQWDRSFALEQVGDDEELLEELIDLFYDSSITDLEKIKTASRHADMESMGDAAHSIKGASASLGIEGIRVVSAALERAGRDSDREKAESLLPHLEALLAEFKTVNRKQ
ncbi:MAG: Hpt domain-containing protein [Pseudomonadota bacterium]